MGFGTFIREKREQANVPMNEFARSLGISPAYWSRIERELEKPPKDELITKAAEALGLNPDEAFIEASRLPPDMQKDVSTVVRLYRKNLG
ncbi:helix-turn-helix protein [Tepidimonas ignava]|uniref:HTH-type transcriptional regulator n=1 Tax=Tepidimonas ignava TaxID=114249 RepID=A0A4V2UW95_9BURK|nr:helix-turn-helix transcriptional regulator [Tepidimonas ignava]TCS98727.1 helix-turn-helix protein [Tepidimonas ignava]TSE20346.1 putative HTH-type transcriptional regulator [Tepidimonas ignava]